VDGVDLIVPRGTVCSLLGPNGAGKTTTVRLLTTLASLDAGTATVAGFDVVAEPQQVRRRIGVTAQDATVDGLLTGMQNLVMVGELHHLGRRASRRRAQELLEQFSLVDAADRLARDYSGGMRRRLDLAASLVSRPEVLFLDEPTTGLDPRSRNELWDVLASLVDGGVTLLLTTQYLEEADRLAHDIVVVDHGRVIARGDARSLKRQVGGDQLLVVPARVEDLPRVADILERVTGVVPAVDAASRHVTAPSSGGAGAVAAVGAALHEAEIEIDDMGLHQPTLEDVFLTLTGDAPHGASDAEPTMEAVR
jgi:ABC-2 type transport system ATP-binding protein